MAFMGTAGPGRGGAVRRGSSGAGDALTLAGALDGSDGSVSADGGGEEEALASARRCLELGGRAPTADDLRALREGVTIETVAQRDRRAKPLVAKTKPCEVRAPNARAPRLLEFTLTEGRNRQIRKMCAARGLDVVSLHRTHFAGVTLDGLVAGGWAPLSAKERRCVDAALADRD